MSANPKKKNNRNSRIQFSAFPVRTITIIILIPLFRNNIKTRVETRLDPPPSPYRLIVLSVWISTETSNEQVRLKPEKTCTIITIILYYKRWSIRRVQEDGRRQVFRYWTRRRRRPSTGNREKRSSVYMIYIYIIFFFVWQTAFGVLNDTVKALFLPVDLRHETADGRPTAWRWWGKSSNSNSSSSR